MQLRAFCQAARLQSFRGAAERVLSTQSAVSRRVHALERELGVRLFERHRQSLHLTLAGERLYRLAMPLVEGMDRLPGDFLGRERGSVSGSLDLAAGESAAGIVLAPHLKRFRERYPGVRVNVRVGDQSMRMNWLRAYEVEVIFGALDIPPPDLEFCPLLMSVPMLITPLDHPLAGRKSVTMQDTVDYPLIAHPRGTRIREVMEMESQLHGYTGNVGLEVAGWRMIKRYVEAGLGISLVPELCLAEGDRLWKYPADRYFPARTYGLITRRDGILSLAAKRFMQVVDPSSDSDTDAASDPDAPENSDEEPPAE